MPPVTDQHRRGAFAAFAWLGWTYEQAMADDTRQRVVEARAHHLRKAEWLNSQRRVVRPALPHARDLKRAAAGDFDD
jgi:hypothetical protein